VSAATTGADAKAAGADAEAVGDSSKRYIR
jgi:hypothetical protein